VKIEISYTSPLSLWRTLDKEPLDLTYEFTGGPPCDVPDTIYVEGIDLGTGSITLNLYAATDENPSGEVVATSTLEVSVVNHAPVFDPIQEGQWESPDVAPPDPVFTQGQFVGQLHATDPDGDAITYSMEDASAYLSLDAQSGVITVAVPDGLQNALQSGDITIPVFASDGAATDFCIFGINPFGWLAGPSIIVYTDSGGHRYTPDTAAEFIGNLRETRDRGERITDLIIKGHGGTGGIQVGTNEDDYLTCEGGTIRIGDRDVTALLMDVTNGDSVITLRGCSTYWLAGRIGNRLGNKAYGQLLPRLSIPGTTW